MREMSTAAQATGRDIQTMTRANREQLAVASRVAAQLDDIRRITDRNLAGVKQTRGGTEDLLRQAETLTGIMDDAFGSKGGANGRARVR